LPPQSLLVLIVVLASQRHCVDDQQIAVLELHRHHLQSHTLPIVAELDELVELVERPS
jgi:hypothetical protein